MDVDSDVEVLLVEVERDVLVLEDVLEVEVVAFEGV